VEGIGQIEIDEVYLGVSKRGAHYVIPCQAKSIGDQFGIVQVIQDLEFCKGRYPNAIAKPIAVQFLSTDEVAVLELSVEFKNDVYVFGVVEERQYTLVKSGHISDEQIKKYNQSDA
jgi:hypothetical protein